MIQGGMNLVWTTRAPFLRASPAQTTVSLQPRGYAPVSRALLAVKPTNHAQVPPRLTLRG